MMIHEITQQAGKYKSRKRVGRGHGSGHGKTCGRGHKGAGSRSGYKRRPAFEGGQMPLFRRLPKRGFTNAPFRTHYHVVNVSAIQERFKDGATVDAQTLAASGLIRDANRPVKILGDGELTLKLDVTVAKCSASALAKIEAAGGSVTIVVRRKWTRPAKPKAAPKAQEEPATPAEDVPADDAPAEEPVVEEPATEEAPAEEAPADAPAEDASSEDAPDGDEERKEEGEA